MNSEHQQRDQLHEAILKLPLWTKYYGARASRPAIIFPFLPRRAGCPHSIQDTPTPKMGALLNFVSSLNHEKQYYSPQSYVFQKNKFIFLQKQVLRSILGGGSSIHRRETMRPSGDVRWHLHICRGCLSKAVLQCFRAPRHIFQSARRG